jgi:hypothetical protein
MAAYRRAADQGDRGIAVDDIRWELVSLRSRPAARNGLATLRGQACDYHWETAHSLPSRTWMDLEYADGVAGRVVDRPFGGFAPAPGDAPAVSRVNLQ